MTPIVTNRCSRIVELAWYENLVKLAVVLEEEVECCGSCGSEVGMVKGEPLTLARQCLQHLFPISAISEYSRALLEFSNKPFLDTRINYLYNCTIFHMMRELVFGQSSGHLDNAEYTSWVRSGFAAFKALPIVQIIQ